MMKLARYNLSATAVAFLLLCQIANAQRPDVLFIIVDDLRPMLGCYGDTRIKTPNIDRLATRGVVFENAYCNYAKCGTSRLSLLTGLRPASVDVYSNNARDVVRFREQRPDAISLPRWLKDHGYHTQSFGKIYHDGWDNAEDWSAPSQPGRDREMWEVVDESDLTLPTTIAERIACPVMQNPDVADNQLFAGRMSDRIIRELKERSSDKPQFIAAGYRRPHLPFVAPKRYFDLYSPDASWLAKNPRPSTGAPVMAWFNSDGYVGTAKKLGLVMPTRPTRDQAISWNGYELRSYVGVPNQGEISEQLQLDLLQAYAACISYVDAQIGRLLAEVEASNNSRDTIIVLCSDHGWHLGEHSAWGKMTNYEIATRVPLIVTAPNLKPGRTKTIAELVDLYPTICDLTGVKKPKHLEGDTLTTALSSPQKTDETSYALSRYSRFRSEYMGTALRTPRYRFIQWTERKTNRVVHVELYDHQSDGSETNNLAAERKDHAAIQALIQRLKSIELQRALMKSRSSTSN